MKMTTLLACGAAAMLLLATFPREVTAHSLGRRADSADCKPAFRGRVGLAVKKSKAKKRAERKWRNDVTLKYGLGYRRWRDADRKDYHCKKKRGTWRCRAHAYPCHRFQEAVQD